MPKEFVVNGEIVIQENALDNYDEGISLNLEFIPIKETSYKQNNGFGSYICEIANAGDNPPIFSAKGTFVRPLDLGQTYSGKGEINSWRGTKQFKIDEVKKVMPKGKRGIISFLKSLNGMTYQADMIYDEYGENSLNIIKNSPMDLMTLINGAYPEMLLDWQHQVNNIKDDYSMLTKLMALGIRSDQGKVLYDKYGALVFEMLKNNPYFLSKEIPGYGFKRCDIVARNMGVEINHPNRMCEGIMSVLKDIGDEGHTYIKKSNLTELSIDKLSLKLTIPEMKKIVKQLNKDGTCNYVYGDRTYTLDSFEIVNALKAYNMAYSKKQKDSCRVVVESISEKDVEEAYKLLLLEERIVVENDKIYDKKTYMQETGIANFVKDLHRSSKPTNVDIQSLIYKYCSTHKVNLEDKQLEAVTNSASSFGDIFIISGAAGCGKTFCIKAILEILEEIYTNKQGFFSKIIIAPTGKASRVAAKATGIESSTVHRALMCKPGGGFFYNINNKLPYDCIVIDESSMLDCNIAYNLFCAIAPTTKVIMVGDPNQLPSIGAGNILKDMISSNTIQTTTLNVIKRQGADSGIVVNSHRIINGEMISSNKETRDSIICKADSDIDYIQKVLKYCDQLVTKYGIDGTQVLSPQRTGPLGTNYLNFILQERYNKVKSSEKILKQRFEVSIDGSVEEHELFLKKGDKVINIRNNYTMLAYQIEDGYFVVDDSKIGVTNGETGTIVQITQQTNEFNEWDNHVVVKFEDRYVIYNNDFEDLELCYAMTIHKSQGSEWPGVLMVIHPGHKYMLDKNILYTGLTRAKENSIIISDGNILRFAIANDKSITRNTGLVQWLRQIK